MDKGLTELQQKFIDEYMKTGNARKSAIVAGYTETSADNASVNILGSAVVKAEIKLRLGMLREKYVHQLNIMGQQAVKAELDVLKDEGAKSRDKLSAARDILDRIGVVLPKAFEITGPERGPIVIVRSSKEHKKILAERRKREEEDDERQD
ncbi:MAG: terminase small subunit [Candidatus Bathyarchaeota archaeon]|nr:terminase small subunit [Candidatus Bathyarchaeota archaeon]